MKQNLKDGKGHGVYLNYIENSVENWEELYFGKNYARLQEIKAKYDPNHVFQRKYAAIEAKRSTKQHEDL